MTFLLSCVTHFPSGNRGWLRTQGAIRGAIKNCLRWLGVRAVQGNSVLKAAFISTSQTSCPVDGELAHSKVLLQEGMSAPSREGCGPLAFAPQETSASAGNMPTQRDCVRPLGDKDVKMKRDHCVGMPSTKDRLLLLLPLLPAPNFSSSKQNRRERTRKQCMKKQGVCVCVFVSRCNSSVRNKLEQHGELNK